MTMLILPRFLRLEFVSVCLTALVALTFCGNAVHAQTLLDVDFDQRANDADDAYTEAKVEADFGEFDFTNGVDEGRVQLVSGQQAFGGTGAALRVEFLANGTGPREGGAQWLVEFDQEHEEAFLSYRVKFENGFDFVRGGKLPGLAGGSAPSGSTPADGVRGWTGRLMWRTNFRGESGFPEQSTTHGISYAKHVHSGFDQDGRQEDRVFWTEEDETDTTMVADVWYTIRQRIRMNTPGERDGIIQIWLDNRLVLDQDNIQFRNIPDLAIDHFFFSTFFGGGDAWRSSKHEVIFFDDFKISVPQQLLVPEQYPNVQAAVAAANPGDTILLGSADWFGNLSIDQPLTIQGRGNARLMAADGSLPVIQVNADSVTIADLQIDRGAAGVVASDNADNLQIRNCGFSNNFGDAIRAVGPTNVSIENTDVVSNEGRGIFLDGADRYYIYNCTAIENGGAGFELFSDDGFIGNCEASRNRAGAGFFFIGSRCGVQGNTATDNSGMGFLLLNGRSNGLSNNIADGNTIFGVLAYAVDDSDFANNLIQQSGDVGVIFDNANRNSFRDNISSFNNGIGAFASSSTSDNSFTGNEYSGNAFSLGLIDQGNNFVAP